MFQIQGPGFNYLAKVRYFVEFVLQYTHTIPMKSTHQRAGTDEKLDVRLAN